MDRKVVLFFGVTGVDKGPALDRLAKWKEPYNTDDRIRVVDFEREYLFNPERGGKKWFSFLDDQQQMQREIWHRTWARFVEEIPFAVDKDLFVAIHGCIVRGHYGVRPVIDPRDVAEWVDPRDPERRVRPDLIVTLLDEVYDMWWRTERRAEGNPLFGRPTIEQLVFARRAELTVADQVAHSVNPPIPHFIISVAHPCETLGHRIYSAHPMVVYLCFPISAPRDLKKDESDPSGETEIMGFLQTAYERQGKDPDLVVVCPLGIDELPLVEVTRGAIRRLKPEDDVNKAAPVQFDRDSLRWAMDSVWAPDTCLSPGSPPSGNRDPIPLAQLEAAAGMMHTDVGWRDYRLVEQAKDGCLAVFNPKFKNRPDLSRSVYQEILFATSICPVFVYQDYQVHDPGKIVEARFPQEGGTMPLSPQTYMVKLVNSVEDLFDEVEKLAAKKSGRRLR